MTPTKEVLKAIVNLKHNKDFEIIIAWLEREHPKTAIESTKIMGQHGDWVAGQAQALDMLLNRFKTAEAKLQEIKSKQNEQKGPIV